MGSSSQHQLRLLELQYFVPRLRGRYLAPRLESTNCTGLTQTFQHCYGHKEIKTSSAEMEAVWFRQLPALLHFLMHYHHGWMPPGPEMLLTPLGSGCCVQQLIQLHEESAKIGLRTQPWAGFGPAVMLRGLQDRQCWAKAGPQLVEEDKAGQWPTQGAQGTRECSQECWDAQDMFPHHHLPRNRAKCWCCTWVRVTPGINPDWRMNRSKTALPRTWGCCWMRGWI